MSARPQVPAAVFGLVNLQAEVYHRSCQHRIDEFPSTKRATDVCAYCPGRENGIEAPSGTVGHKDMMATKRIPPITGPMIAIGAIVDTPDMYFSWTKSRCSAVIKPVARMTMPTGFKPTPGWRPKRRVAVLAYDGVVLGALATPLEIFSRVRDPNGQPCYEVRVCGVADEVKSEHLRLKVPWRLSSVAHAETVIVPGIDRLERIVPTAISNVLRSASRRGARIASICTGAIVLARTGLLDGLRQLLTGELQESWRGVIRESWWMPMCST